MLSKQTLKTFVAKEHAAALDDLAALITAGTLRPAVDRIHDLDDAATAVRRMESGEIRGKDVIAVNRPTGR